MPKRFTGENSKAVVAKAKKAALREAEAAKKQQAIEDEYWRDDDKHLIRKAQRKEEKERKRQEQLDKKAENKTIAAEELKTIAPSKVSAPVKITRSQVQLELEKKQQDNIKESPEIETHLTKPLEENINHLTADESSARNIDDAISILSINDSEQKSVDKNMKAAFTAFEATNMPRLKAENPTLRLSQLKQLLRKEWLRSSENPVNQRLKLKS